ATLRDELAQVEESLASDDNVATADVRAAMEIFEFSQKIGRIWRGSKMLEKRRILETVSLNRMLGDVSLVIEKRKPFCELAKRPHIQLSRDDARSFEPYQSWVSDCVESYPASRPSQLLFLAGVVDKELAVGI
ncbi:hypothetical protein OAF42_01585, partial [Planctomicrobium sp.]